MHKRVTLGLPPYHGQVDSPYPLPSPYPAATEVRGLVAGQALCAPFWVAFPMGAEFSQCFVVQESWGIAIICGLHGFACPFAVQHVLRSCHVLLTEGGRVLEPGSLAHQRATQLSMERARTLEPGAFAHQRARCFTRRGLRRRQPSVVSTAHIRHFPKKCSSCGFWTAERAAQSMSN